ncbi:nose resistant to fluoxetine protein 6-like isoform X4 [Diabrotica virgifera virgifera]|uniref:Acyltransferase 3 domain-containing protein n=2 Tax=Diabrotica virgifera virgifera TaxID=50390 RepID=A0ABM5L744_DIAVI|nr:nose resistant to fluoxetine protein 6-like isoform X4 [Diabrotica virgifera virgifera]
MNVLFNVVFLILVTVFSTTKGLVTDKDYASLPDLFHQDNFDKCMLFGDEALYCNFEYELEPLNNENALWKTIQELSKDDCNYRHDNLRHWICVPTSCPNVTEKFEDGTTLTKQINNCYDNKMLKYGFKGTVKNLTCDTNKSKFPVNWIDILVGFLFIAYISFVLLCTIVDNVIQSCYEKDYEDFSNTSYGRMVISFSLYRSWIRLTTVKSTPEVDYFRPLQGVRFYNQIIVILSHTTLAGLVSSVANTKFVESMNSSIGSIFLSSGPMCVSTMFCLSSTFLSYGIFSHFEKRKLTLNVLVMLFVERYLRLIPPLAVVLLFNVTWWRHLGNGPNWNRIVGKEYLNCRKNMWTNLLFVNNLIDAENMCTPTTWSVALDTQYFILLLLLLWYIKKHEKYILHIVGSLLCTGILITFYINYINKLEAFTIPRAETVYDMKNLGGNPHWQKQFMSLSGNTCGPLLGVIFGYIIYKTRNVEMFKQKRTMWKILFYLFSYVPALSIIIIPGWYILVLKPEYDPFMASFIAVIGRPIFVLAIGFGAYGCLHGIGGITEQIVKWRPVYVLGRLSYSVYLVQCTLILSRAGIARTPVYLSEMLIVYHLLADVAASFLVALLLTLFFEMPVSAVTKYILPQQSKNTEEKKEQ